MNPNALAQLRDIMAEAEGLSAMLAPPPAPAPEAELTDETESVTIVLRAARIDTVRLSAQWRNRIEPAMLASTIVTLQVQHALGPVKAMAERDRDGVAPAARPVAPPLRPFNVPRDESSIERMLQTVRSAQDAVKTLGQFSTTQVNQKGATGTSENSRVTAVVRDGLLVDLTLEEQWIESAALQSVVESINQAIAAAHQARAEEPDVEDAEPDAIADLQAMLQSMGLVKEN